MPAVKTESQGHECFSVGRTVRNAKKLVSPSIWAEYPGPSREPFEQSRLYGVLTIVGAIRYRGTAAVAWLEYTLTLPAALTVWAR